VLKSNLKNSIEKVEELKSNNKILSKQRWPNFFLVGAPKCGTTSLFNYLHEVPEIFMCSVPNVNYFTSKGFLPSRIHTIKEKYAYLDLFKDAKRDQILGEYTPYYIFRKESPSMIKKVSPNARILISLRDPVERAFSHYLMHVSRGQTKLSFHELLENELKEETLYSEGHLKLEAGWYFENVKRYFETFGKQNVKVILLNDLKVNPEKTTQDILSFLGISVELSNFGGHIHNKFSGVRGPIAQNLLTSKRVSRIAQKLIPLAGRKIIRNKILVGNNIKPMISLEDKEELKKYYREDVLKLQTLLDRKLPWRNFFKTQPSQETGLSK